MSSSWRQGDDEKASRQGPVPTVTAKRQPPFHNHCFGPFSTYDEFLSRLLQVT
jgi:hypothetical protein